MPNDRSGHDSDTSSLEDAVVSLHPYSAIEEDSDCDMIDLVNNMDRPLFIPPLPQRRHVIEPEVREVSERVVVRRILEKERVMASPKVVAALPNNKTRNGKCVKGRGVKCSGRGLTSAYGAL